MTMERGNRPPSSTSRWPQPAEGARSFDFRLHFQASRVPSSGWDKLVVSLISIDTGKTTVKTSRGLVRNGTCQWLDPVVESSRITQDPASGVYDEKLYKLLVQMGSLRVGILGEETINLTDYINANSPDTISLPLKKCIAGTVLHVKIQCLTPKGSLRELERQRNTNLDGEDLRSVSEDDGSGSDFSENLTVGSVVSSASQAINGQSYLPNSQKQFKTNRGIYPSTIQTDGPLSITTSRQNSDASDSSSYGNNSSSGVGKDFQNGDFGSTNTLLPRRSNSTASQDRSHSEESSRSSYASNQYVGAHLPSTTKGWQDAYTWQAEYTNPDLLSSPSLQNGVRVLSSLPQKLDAAEETIWELREETLTWERQARKLNVETEMLRQQLAAELKNGAELRIRISALEAECDTLRSEVERLRASKVALKSSNDGDDYTRLDIYDTKRLVMALQEEVTYENEVNANLHLQLHKTQDSITELVSVITELEETLKLRNSEINRLADVNEGLEEQLHKVQASKAELFCSVAELEETASTSRVMEMLTKTDDMLDQPVHNESEEGLLEMIEILKKQMEEQDLDSNELTDESIELLRKLNTANRELEANMKLIAELETTLEGLSRVKTGRLLKQLLGNKLSEKQGFIDELKIQVQELEQKNAILEQQLQRASVDYEALLRKNEVAHSKEPLHGAVKDHIAMLSVSTMEKTEAIDADDAKGGLVEITSKQILCLEAENADFREQVTLLKRELENSTREIQKQKEEIDLQLSQEKYKADDQLRKRTAELSELYQNLEIHRATERKLKAEVSEHCVDIERLIQELAERVACEKKLEVQLIEAENERVLLDKKLQALMADKELSQSRIEELESRLPILLEEIKLLNASKSKYQSSNLKLEIEKAEMEEKLDEEHDQSRAARERLDELVGQMAALTTTLDSQLIAKRTLERKALELESDKEELETQVFDLEDTNAHLLERIAGVEAQIKYMIEERDSYKLELETARAQCLEDQTQYRQLHATYQEMLRVHKQQSVELEHRQAFASQEATRHDQIRQSLEQELDKKKDEVSSLMLSHSELKKGVIDFQQQLQEAGTECAAIKEKCSALEAEIAQRQREGDFRELSFRAEMALPCSVEDGFENHANKAEDLLQLQRENVAAVDFLQNDLQRQLSSTSDGKEKLASQALIEAAELRAEKAELEDCPKNLQAKLKETEEQSYTLQNKAENKIEGMAKELQGSKNLLTESSQKLQETQILLKEMTAAQTDGLCKIKNLESLLSESESIRHSLLNEQVLLGSKASEVVAVKLELENIKSTLDQMSLEKSTVQSSLKATTAQCAILQQEKITNAEMLTQMVLELGELKQQKADLEEKMLLFKSLLEAHQEAGKRHEVEQRNELLHLKRHVSQVQRNLVDQEEEKMEYQRRVESLEEELLLKMEALSRTEKKLKAIEASGGGGQSLDRTNSRGGLSFALRDSKEVLVLREKLKLLQEYAKSKEQELDSCKIEFMERETDLCDRIEHLELYNEQLAGDDQLKNELIRLQNQNSFLSRKEQQLLSSMRTQEVLQEEVQRLQEANELLESRLFKLIETAKNPFLLEKIVNLEMELTEALEANNMYKLQLKGVFEKQQNISMASLRDLGELDEIRKDLSDYKKKAAQLEDELHDMNERYILVSLELAEAETRRGELLITLKNLRSMKRT